MRNKHYKTNRSQRGATLIEAGVVIALVSLVAMAGVANFSEKNKCTLQNTSNAIGTDDRSSDLALACCEGPKMCTMTIHDCIIGHECPPPVITCMCMG